MSKFIVILSDKSESTLAATYEKSLAVLRPVAQRILPILPHLILIQSELDKEALARTLHAEIPTHGNWLLLEIQGGFRGSALVDRHKQLQDFFELP